MKILAIIFDGYEELEANAPFALIRRAGLDLTIASNKNTITGAHGISMTNLTPVESLNLKDYNALIMPGGPEWKFMLESSMVHQIIKHFIENNKYVCAICGAPTVLGALGYLKGKNYTCFEALNNDFGGNFKHDGIVVDGKLITGKSAAFAIDFGYTIIKELAGQEVLDTVWKHIYYEK